MPFEKGNPGKPKGSKNKKSLLVEETAARLKCNPFEILCLFANGDWKRLGYDNECYHKETDSGEVKMGYTISPDMRLQAAKEASKYLYAQRRALEVDASVVQVTDTSEQVRELAAWYKDLREMK